MRREILARLGINVKRQTRAELGLATHSDCMLSWNPQPELFYFALAPEQKYTTRGTVSPLIRHPGKYFNLRHAWTHAYYF